MANYKFLNLNLTSDFLEKKFFFTSWLIQYINFNYLEVLSYIKIEGAI